MFMYMCGHIISYEPRFNANCVICSVVEKTYTLKYGVVMQLIPALID